MIIGRIVNQTKYYKLVLKKQIRNSLTWAAEIGPVNNRSADDRTTSVVTLRTLKGV